MINVNKPINLEQLDKELNGQGLVAPVDENLNVIAVGLAENNSATYEELQIAINNHIAVFTEPTVAEKLASVGLSIEELKAALGGN
jgi:hypothetical protein